MVFVLSILDGPTLSFDMVLKEDQGRRTIFSGDHFSGDLPNGDPQNRTISQRRALDVGVFS